jgi:WD40 repeat protein
VWAWDNPEHLTKMQTNLGGAVLDIDWDSESKKIVAVGEGTTVLAKCMTWDTGNTVGEMVGHNKRILSVAYKPSRPFRIFTAAEDFRTCFYAGPPFKLSHSNNSLHSNFVNCIRYSPDGSKAVSVGTDKVIQVYDGKEGQPTGNVIGGHNGGIYSVAFSPDGSKFATASADKTVKIWDMATLNCEVTFTISPDPQVGDMQVSVVWTPTTLLSLSLNGSINILDPSSPNQPVNVIQNHQSAITAIYLDQTTATLYTGDIDGVICSRNLETGATCKVLGQDKRSVCGGAHSGNVSGVAYTGIDIISIGWDDAIRFADPATNAYNDSQPLNGQPKAITASSQCPGVAVVVTLSELNLFRGREKVGVLTGMSYAGTCASLLRDEEVAVGGDDNKTHIYSISNNEFTEIAVIETRSPVSSVCYSPTGDVLAIGDNGRQVEVYERGSWAAKVKGRWVFHTSKITSLAWSPNGNFLASGSTDESVIVWNLSALSDKTQMSFAHMAGVTGVAWLDDTRLVSVGNDHSIVTWRFPNP